MDPVLAIGIIIVVGFIFGELAQKIKLPRVIGFIIAGIVLNPDLAVFFPHTAAQSERLIRSGNLVINLALCFITFSIGGTLSLLKLKKLGKGILWITILEAQFAFLFVTIGVLAAAFFMMKGPAVNWLNTYIPFALLIGCIASPTDPTPSLAISHEYKAEGDVTSTILGVSALDDAVGIINFSLAMVAASSIALHTKFSLYTSMGEPLIMIIGSLALGAFFGLLLNAVSLFLNKKTEGALIVAIFGLLALCFGIANTLKWEALLATMAMGVMVVNFNPIQDKIFRSLERYTEELIFLMFFVLSGMQLKFSVLPTASVMIIFFVILRVLGKTAGTVLGAAIAGSSGNVKKFTSAGLIPYGGIVVGLGLIMKQVPEFSGFADIIIAVVIGATILSEIIGSVCIKFALKGAGEIK
jgi:NhaP-type Na+/H+ or K+/H+ antiporter